ncbi:hypothetical protein [Streptomyces puniciscabiei]|nr:hypothetical protein [Streptomyces puniciscabiei]
MSRIVHGSPLSRTRRSVARCASAKPTRRAYDETHPDHDIR